MKTLSVLLLVALLLCDCVRGDDCVEGEEGCEDSAPSKPASKIAVADKENDIYVLTDDNFAEIVKDEELIMATFYAPW